jgi:PEP-CTERM motif
MKPVKVFSIMLLLLLLLLLASSLPAVAGTVTITFTGTGGNAYNGVASWPYNGAINDVPNDFMCISYNEHIEAVESWTATQYSVSGYGSLIGNPTEAQQLAYLYLQSENAANGAISAAYNAAAWYLNEGVPDITGDPLAYGYYNRVLGLGSYPGIANVQFYVPVAGTASNLSLGIPQIFIAETPEPSTLTMMGSGLLGLAGLARKRFFS